MRYGSRDVLQGVDLSIEHGEILALLGPNGAGKTTTLEILEGFRKRSAGHVEVLGVDPEKGNEAWRARLGVVLQSWRDHRRWRVRETLHHLGQYFAPYSLEGQRRPLDTDEILHRVGLQDEARTVIRHLSGGQRRRLDVAIGLIGNPELLFLDEPTVGFDPEARYSFHKMIREVASGSGTAVILTTHDLAEAEALAENIAILVNGKIAAYGTADHLSSRFSRTVTVSYRMHDDSRRDEVPADHASTFVRRLLNMYGEAISDLEVRRFNLEDTYLSMVGITGADSQLATNGADHED
ncbi:ABC transporter ATP-binding protein [Brevibacterium luteolum]|nr:ABC transporter ATP-binding protein [Brevibacterium luteolum]